MPDTHQEVLPPPQPRRPSVIRNLPSRLPERGHIKIGGLGDERESKKGNKFQLPEKYDHFKITTLERSPDGNFAIDKALYRKLDLPDEPTEIPVRLLYDDPEINMQSRYACYKGKTLWCSGDGVEATRRSARYDDQQPAKEPLRVACPCHRQDPSYTGADRCKMNGSLAVLIDGAGSIGGVWMFRTTSYNSIVGITSSLDFLRTITGGILANIPLKLRLVPKLATSPTDGKTLKIWIVTLEYDGDMAELQALGFKIALDRATTHVSIANIEEEARRRLALPMPENAVLPGDDPEAIVAEYYPEQNDEMAGARTPPPRPSRDAPAPQPEQESKVPTYAIIDSDGVETLVEAEVFVEKMIAAIDEAAKLGYDTWRGVMQSNAPQIKALEVAGGDGAKMAAEISAYCKANKVQPPKGKATEPVTPTAENAKPPAGVDGGGMGGAESGVTEGETSNQPGESAPAEPAEKAKDATSTAASPGPSSTGEAPKSFWDRESYAIDPPMKRGTNEIHFGQLQNALMWHADQAQTADELEKFKADNADNLRSLRAYNASVAETVEARFLEIGKRIAGGG